MADPHCSLCIGVSLLPSIMNTAKTVVFLNQNSIWSYLVKILMASHGQQDNPNVFPWHSSPSATLCMFSSVQSLSCVGLFVTPWITARQASLSITISRSSPKPTSIESVNAIQPSHPLSSPFPPAPNPSKHQSLFQWVNSSHEVAKVLDFQL